MYWFNDGKSNITRNNFEIFSDVRDGHRAKKLINERTKAYFSHHVPCMDRRELKCASINIRTVKVKLVHYRP